MASSSGVLCCATSFCMELRIFPGIFITPAITASASTFAPSATATAALSRRHERPSSRHTGSESISPVVLSAAVVDSANAARKTSLPHMSVGSSSTKRHSKPSCWRYSTGLPSRARPAEDTFSRANGERWTMCPGATRSVSTAMVAAMTRSFPNRDRSSARWSMPLSSGTIAPTDSGLVNAARAGTNSVAFTVIQSTSTGGTVEARATGTLKLPNALSSWSCSGYRASDSGLTTRVTGAPDRARHAPIRPPIPPAPRIACRKGDGEDIVSRVCRLSVFARRGGHAFQNIRLAQRVVALLGASVNAFHDVVGGRNAAPLQPEQHIRFSAHGAHVDDLLETEHMRRHTGIYGVRQQNVIFAIRLDDRGGVNPGGGAESVVTDHGIIRRNRHARGP